MTVIFNVDRTKQADEIYIYMPMIFINNNLLYNILVQL